jgi:hypothetical protein
MRRPFGSVLPFIAESDLSRRQLKYRAFTQQGLPAQIIRRSDELKVTCIDMGDRSQLMAISPFYAKASL